MEARKTIVFVRDDDVGPLTDELMVLSKFFIESDIPVNYQIIPAALTDEAAEWLRKSKEQYGSLIGINQHGYKHALYKTNGEVIWNGEFGRKRNYHEQLKDLAAGKAIMDDHFGDFFTPVFTPPGNKYTKSTIRALHELGFKVNSGSIYADVKSRLFHSLGRGLKLIYFGHAVSYHGSLYCQFDVRDLSISIDVDMRLNRKGEVTTAGKDILLREFDRAKSYYDIVGIMLHHHTYVNKDKMIILKDFINTLRDDPEIEFKSMETISRMEA